MLNEISRSSKTVVRRFQNIICFIGHIKIYLNRDKYLRTQQLKTNKNYSYEENRRIIWKRKKLSRSIH